VWVSGVGEQRFCASVRSRQRFCSWCFRADYRAGELLFASVRLRADRLLEGRAANDPSEMVREHAAEIARRG